MTEAELAQLIKDCKGVIYLCGNGGSAATASHFATDLIKMGYPVISLVESVPVITMIANDYGFEFVFSRQMAHTEKDDMLIALSVSGSSENIIFAVRTAHYREMTVVGLLGKSRCKADNFLSYSMHAQSDDYRSAENEHMYFLHGVSKELKYD